MRAIDFEVDVVGAGVASDEDVDVMLGGIYASVDEVDDKPHQEKVQKIKILHRYSRLPVVYSSFRKF